MLDPFNGAKSFVFASEVTGKRYDMEDLRIVRLRSFTIPFERDICNFFRTITVFQPYNGAKSFIFCF